MDDDVEFWPPRSNGFGGVVVRIILAFAVVFVLIVIGFYAFAAQAHIEHRHDLDEWFSKLRAGGIPCCSPQDSDSGNLVPVEDVVTAEEFARHNCRPTINDATYADKGGPFSYCVNIYGLWWLVPDRVVLKEPNRHGQALAFLSWSWVGMRGDQKVVSFFRCFLPGAGT